MWFHFHSSHFSCVLLLPGVFWLCPSKCPRCFIFMIFKIQTITDITIGIQVQDQNYHTRRQYLPSFSFHFLSSSVLTLSLVPAWSTFAIPGVTGKGRLKSLLSCRTEPSPCISTFFTMWHGPLRHVSHYFPV